MSEAIPEGTTPEGTEGTTPDPTPTEPIDWKLQVNEEFRGDTGLNEIKSVSDLAKGYLSGQRMLGDRIKIPGETASDEDRAAFNTKLTEIPGVLRIPEEGDEEGFRDLYSKLGRPESADKYTYKTENLPEGLESSSVIEDWFKKSAFESGASNEMVSKIMGEWNEMLVTQHNVKQEDMNVAEAALHKDWGNDYARRMGAGRALVTKYGNDQVDEAIEASGLGNNPYFNKMMSDIGMSNLEDSAINAGLQSASETPPEIQEKINEGMSHPAYMNPKDPQHKDIVAKVFKLRQQLSALT